MTADQGYSFGAVSQILGIPESKLRYWSQIGFVGPSARRGGRQIFSFQDLVTVRAAKELVARGIGTAQIRRALESVRASLPALDRPLERLRVAFDGNALVVLDDGAVFEPTGQRLFDFGLGELAARASRVGPAPRPLPTPATSAPTRTSYEWFTEGVRLEAEGDDAAARAAYLKALEGDRGLAAAHTNLGAIAYREDDFQAARRAFGEALALDPDQPEARYNLARLLYEEGEIELAASELRQVIRVAPAFADAHYNLATALERLGSTRQAREHLERFVALAPQDDPEDAVWVEAARAKLLRLG